MPPIDPEIRLARATFEMARRGFARHLAWAQPEGRDARHLADLVALAERARPGFPGGEAHDSELVRMRARLAEIQRARSVRHADPGEIARLSMLRVHAARMRVIGPQGPATPRPDFLRQLAALADDARTLAALADAPGELERLDQRARRAADALSQRVDAVVAARATMSAAGLSEALLDELDAAVRAAEDATQLRPRLLALDRVHEAQRQLVRTAATGEALAATRVALQATRRLGPGAAAVQGARDGQ